jgi:hypothetical protein
VAGGGKLLARACIRHYTFIGCLCFRTSAWREAGPWKYRELPYFPHLSILAEAMAAPTRRALILARPTVLVRGGGFSWEKRAGEVWFADLQRCLAVVPGYSSRAKRRALWAAWRDIAQYSLGLVAEHGVRFESIRKAWRARKFYTAMNAYGLFAFNLLALCTTLFVPAAVFRTVRHGWRRLARA